MGNYVFEHMEPKPKNHSWGYLIILLIAIVVSLGLVFTKTVDLGQFMRALVGNLTDASKYSLPSESTPDTLPEANLTGTLTVTTNPTRAQYEVLEAGTGLVAISERSSTEPMSLAIGNYRVVFKPLAGYDTPAEISTSVALKFPAKINVSYKPWAACTVADWICSEWSPCEKNTEYRRRTCSQTNPRCTGADSVQPLLYEICAECKKEKRC